MSAKFPSQDLLEQLESAATCFFANSPETRPAYSMDESALIATGVLVEEYIRYVCEQECSDASLETSDES